jgi:hypothetical protein
MRRPLISDIFGYSVLHPFIRDMVPFHIHSMQSLNKSRVKGTEASNRTTNLIQGKTKGTESSKPKQEKEISKRSERSKMLSQIEWSEIQDVPEMLTSQRSFSRDKESFMPKPKYPFLPQPGKNSQILQKEKEKEVKGKKVEGEKEKIKEKEKEQEKEKTKENEKDKVKEK